MKYLIALGIMATGLCAMANGTANSQSNILNASTDVQTEQQANDLSDQESESPAVQQGQAPRIPLDISSAEYQQLLQKSTSRFSRADAQIEEILRVGKRNLDWLRNINSKRNSKLSFTGPHTRVGFPINAPKKYNNRTIVQDYNQRLAALPENMRVVLLSRSPVPDMLPLSEDAYVKLGREIDTSYQNAARWKVMLPYLRSLEERRAEDIRGWYFLNQDPQLESKLTQFSRLPQAEQTQLSNYLVGVCFNSRENYAECGRILNQKIAENRVLEFYQGYKNRSQQIWNDFFQIKRSSYLYAAKRVNGGLYVPFKPVDRDDMRSFLKDNLEQEWQWPGFRVFIDFAYVIGAVEVIWKPGVTPHVPHLGSHQIVMDANTSLTEYEVQWTIKHEFGHNLGFPDCYTEFFERETGLIVAYQMDITDIMCSRKGNIKKRHMDELLKIYGGRL